MNNSIITLKWSVEDSSHLSNQYIYRAFENYEFIKYDSVGIQARSYSDSTFEEGRYSYSISSLNVYGLESDRSNIKTVQFALTSIAKVDELPQKYYLHQNYPNPFNPSTNITYQLPEASDVNISVFDITGRLIQILQNGKKAAGSYTLNFQASNLSSGVYFYRITAGDFVQTKRMLLIK